MHNTEDTPAVVPRIGSRSSRVNNIQKISPREARRGCERQGRNSPRRVLYLSGIPPGVNLRSIIPYIRGGKLERIEFVAQPREYKTKSVRFAFVVLVKFRSIGTAGLILGAKRGSAVLILLKLTSTRSRQPVHRLGGRVSAIS